MGRLTYNSIFDKIHKGAVITCVATAVIGLGFIVMKSYEIVTKVTPDAVEKNKIDKEELLREGREVLVDSIPAMKA